MSDSKIKEIEDKNVRIFGTYMGFSDVMNLPGIGVVVLDMENMDKARIEIEENGKWVEVWNFYTDYAKEEIGKLESSSNSSLETENGEDESKDEPQQTESTQEVESENTPTTGQRNALDKAKSYLKHSNFSYQRLIEQLEYEKFSTEEAIYAVDNCGADWNEQAIRKAKSYLEHSSFSYSGLIKQLEYEKFTTEQATYAVDNCGADWNEQAAKKAQSYLSHSSFSKDRLIEQLEFEGFTHEQAVYGAEQNGY